MRTIVFLLTWLLPYIVNAAPPVLWGVIIENQAYHNTVRVVYAEDHIPLLIAPGFDEHTSKIEFTDEDGVTGLCEVTVRASGNELAVVFDLTHEIAADNSAWDFADVKVTILPFAPVGDQLRVRVHDGMSGTNPLYPDNRTTWESSVENLDVTDLITEDNPHRDQIVYEGVTYGQGYPNWSRTRTTFHLLHIWNYVGNTSPEKVARASGVVTVTADNLTNPGEDQGIGTIGSIGRSGDNVEVNFTPNGTDSFRLEGSSDLEDWKLVGSPILGIVNTPMTFTDTNAFDRRFYRVRRIPAWIEDQIDRTQGRFGQEYDPVFMGWFSSVPYARELDGNSPIYTFGGFGNTWRSAWTADANAFVATATSGVDNLGSTTRIPIEVEPGGRYLASVSYAHKLRNSGDDREYVGSNASLAIGFAGNSCGESSDLHPLYGCGRGYAWFGVKRFGAQTFGDWQLYARLGTSAPPLVIANPSSTPLYQTNTSALPGGFRYNGEQFGTSTLSIELDTTSDPWVIRNYVFVGDELSVHQVGADIALETVDGATPDIADLVVECFDGEYFIYEISLFAQHPNE